jgi:hypothetical protein
MEAIGSAVPSPLSKSLATTIALLGVGLAAPLGARTAKTTRRRGTT